MKPLHGFLAFTAAVGVFFGVLWKDVPPSPTATSNVQYVDRVVEKVVDRPVDRVIEKPVDRVVKEVVEVPVEKIVEKVVTKEYDPKVTFVVFGAEWCQACKQWKPEVDAMIAEGMAITYIDVDKNPAAASQYKIGSYPTLVVRIDGIEVSRINHSVARQDLEGYPRFYHDAYFKIKDSRW